MACSTKSGPFEEEEEEDEGMPGLRVEVWPVGMPTTEAGMPADDFWAYKDPVEEKEQCFYYKGLGSETWSS